jgi:nitroimidazol reductase NimA-like FMN-containing flavoprotein (pyridoxamine 5'-phosphate oxidase superfamily)
MIKNSNRHSEQKRSHNTSQKLKKRCVLFGLSFGLCGVAWILTTYRIPLPAIFYHVPLAVAFGAWFAFVDDDFCEHNNYNFIVVTLLALIVIAGRIFLKWPVSGHGILAALIAVLASWFWLRFFSIAIIFQAFFTKLVSGENPLSVFYGALVGIALAGMLLVKLRVAEKGNLIQPKEKEINDIAFIEDIIMKARVCRLALYENAQPYIVPLCFGYKDNTLYFHSAHEGKKLDMLRNNNKVCFEIDTDHELIMDKEACDCPMKYRSVIGFGKAVFVEDIDSKRRALDIIMQNYSDASFEFPRESIQNTVIITVEVESMTGKKSCY